MFELNRAIAIVISRFEITSRCGVSKFFSCSCACKHAKLVAKSWGIEKSFSANIKPRTRCVTISSRYRMFAKTSSRSIHEGDPHHCRGQWCSFTTLVIAWWPSLFVLWSVVKKAGVLFSQEAVESGICRSSSVVACVGGQPRRRGAVCEENPSEKAGGWRNGQHNPLPLVHLYILFLASPISTSFEAVQTRYIVWLVRDDWCHECISWRVECEQTPARKFATSICFRPSV